MNISAQLLGEVIEHALEDPRNEVCGVLAVEPGPPARAVRVYRAVNIHRSPLKFEIDPMELLELWNACQEGGSELGEPYPSQTDVNFAANWPGVEWIIVGLAGGDEPTVRTYEIEGSDIKELNISETAM
jgi:proteasome lid subunit RPN8/RPN11